MKLEKKIYTDQAEKRKDLRRGAGLFFGLNVPLYLIIFFVYSLIENSFPSIADVAYISLLFVLPLLINIVVLVYFAITRSQVALGMLATMGVVLAVGLIASAACYALIINNLSY